MENSTIDSLESGHHNNNLFIRFGEVQIALYLISFFTMKIYLLRSCLNFTSSNSVALSKSIWLPASGSAALFLFTLSSADLTSLRVLWFFLYYRFLASFVLQGLSDVFIILLLYIYHLSFLTFKILWILIESKFPLLLFCFVHHLYLSSTAFRSFHISRGAILFLDCTYL